MKIKVAITTLAFVMVLTGCNEKIYDVSYYIEHQDEAVKVMEQCKTGEVADDNCKNAAESLKKKTHDKIINKVFG